MSYSEDMPFKFVKVDVVDENGHALDNPTNMQRECTSLNLVSSELSLQLSLKNSLNILL